MRRKQSAKVQCWNCGFLFGLVSVPCWMKCNTRSSFCFYRSFTSFPKWPHKHIITKIIILFLSIQFGRICIQHLPSLLFIHFLIKTIHWKLHSWYLCCHNANSTFIQSFNNQHLKLNVLPLFVTFSISEHKCSLSRRWSCLSIFESHHDNTSFKSQQGNSKFILIFFLHLIFINWITWELIH